MSQYWTYISEWQSSSGRAPPDGILFAVGDIHGRLDLLTAMQRTIRQQMALSVAATRSVIYLGDYIDRGRNSLEVLRTLAKGMGDTGVNEHYLLGNHDLGLQHLLEMEFGDNELLLIWFEYGGKNTLERMGVPWPGYFASKDMFGEYQQKVRAVLGAEVVRFLECLPAFHQNGDYLFVHAGIDPNRGGSIDQQDFADLLLMREPFLSWPSPWPFPFCVVHGHTPARPTVRAHRIGVDTGAFYTDTLTAAQFEGTQVRFVSVSTRRTCDWLESLPDNGWRNTYGPPQRIEKE